MSDISRLDWISELLMLVVIHLLSILGTSGKQDEHGSTWQGKKSCQRVSGQHVHDERQTCSRSLSWWMMLMQMAKLMILMRQGSFNPCQTSSYQVVVWCHTSCAGGEDCIGLGCRSWGCIGQSIRPHAEAQGETRPELHCRRLTLFAFGIVQLPTHTCFRCRGFGQATGQSCCLGGWWGQEMHAQHLIPVQVMCHSL